LYYKISKNANENHDADKVKLKLARLHQYFKESNLTEKQQQIILGELSDVANGENSLEAPEIGAGVVFNKDLNNKIVTKSTKSAYGLKTATMKVSVTNNDFSLGDLYKTEGDLSGGGLTDIIDTKNAKSSSCNWWWLTGSHRYSWSSWWIYADSKLSTNQYTRYGTSSSICNTPLIVDKLQVVGNTVKSGNTGRYEYFPLRVRVNKTKYNTAGFSERKSNSVVGTGVTTPCGAIVDHKATHYGVNWRVRSASGCAR
jgi:hypothetical protein